MSDEITESSSDSVSFFATPFFWLAAIAAGLAGLLYYPLFFPPATQGLTIQSEEFFFEANEAAGAPVLVLSLWLFYRRTHYLDLLKGMGEPLWGVPVLGVTAALFGWGHYTSAPDLQLMTVIPLLFGTVLCLGGRRGVRAFWVPIVFLGFALPLPPVLLSAVMFPIQLVTTEYAGFILNAIGVKSLVSGDQILRPENTFIVIETCSGVRTIVTLSMLTVLLIGLFERKGMHALLLVLLAPIVAFISNGLRVVTLVLNPHSSIHSIHNLQGIMMLLVGLTAMYMIDILLERILGSDSPLQEQDAARDENEASKWASIGGLFAKSWTAVLLTLVAMIITIRVVSPFSPPEGLEETPDALLTRVFGESSSRVIAPDFQFRGSLRYLAHADRLIRFEGEPVEVFLGVGNEIVRAHTLLSKRLSWPESGWAPISESTIELSPGGPPVRRMLLQRGGRKVLSYAWYPRAGGTLAEWWRQAAALDRSPVAREEHMLAVRISAPVGRGRADLDQVDKRLRRVWAQLRPELEGYAPFGTVGVPKR